MSKYKLFDRVEMSHDKHVVPKGAAGEIVVVAGSTYAVAFDDDQYNDGTWNTDPDPRINNRRYRAVHERHLDSGTLDRLPKGNLEPFNKQEENDRLWSLIVQSSTT